MALKAVVESLEGVDDALHGEYTEAEDGKFYLSVDGVDNLPTVKGLANTLKRFKEVAPDASRLKSKMDRLAELEGFGGLELSAEEVAERLQELDELKATGDGKVDEKIEALRETYEKRQKALADRHGTEVETLREELSKRDRHIARREIDNALQSALAKVKSIEDSREAQIDHLKSRHEIKVVDDDGDYRAVVVTDLGDVDIETFVDSWSRSDAAAWAMPASGNKGSGAKGQGGGTGSARNNPWAKDTFNLTEQGRLLKENRPLAERLAAEAGKTLPKA